MFGGKIIKISHSECSEQWFTKPCRNNPQCRDNVEVDISTEQPFGSKPVHYASRHVCSFTVLDTAFPEFKCTASVLGCVTYRRRHRSMALMLGSSVQFSVPRSNTLRSCFRSRRCVRRSLVTDELKAMPVNHISLRGTSLDATQENCKKT